MQYVDADSVSFDAKAGYDRSMARGWESKSVEDQISDKDIDAGKAAAKKQDGITAAVRKRQQQELELQREHILAARTSSPHRRAALEAALADIEARMAKV